MQGGDPVELITWTATLGGSWYIQPLMVAGWFGTAAQAPAPTHQIYLSLLFIYPQFQPQQFQADHEADSLTQNHS